MKKRIVVMFMTLVIVSSFLVGCGFGKKKDTPMTDKEDTQKEEFVRDTEEMLGTEIVPGSTQADEMTLGAAVEVPKGFESNMAEEAAHPELELVIAQYCNVPEENYEQVRYYYNYVDLNGDKDEEILALVLLDGVKDFKENVLLWIDASKEELTKDSVKQAFHKVGAPVFISNEMTEGYRDLIVKNESEDNEHKQENDTMYTLLKYTNEGKYQEIKDGKKLEHLDDYSGHAIITNDIMTEYDKNMYHFLGEGLTQKYDSLKTEEKN